MVPDNKITGRLRSSENSNPHRRTDTGSDTPDWSGNRNMQMTESDYVFLMNRHWSQTVFWHAREA